MAGPNQSSISEWSACHNYKIELCVLDLLDCITKNRMQYSLNKFEWTMLKLIQCSIASTKTLISQKTV
jgi:hypothetical protein